MKLIAHDSEVFYPQERIRVVTDENIRQIAEIALSSPTGKCRICLHSTPEALLHEMLIALRQDVRYPVHRFLGGEETHCLLYGQATLLIYEENGQCLRRIPMGPLHSGRASMVRLPQGTFHDMLIESDVCVYLETKLGPFRPELNEMGQFA